MKNSTAGSGAIRQADGESGEMPFIGASGECHSMLDQRESPLRSGTVGIDPGSPFILGGPRSAELLQMFIENL